MGNDLDHHAAGRFAARRKHAGTRPACVRVAPDSRLGAKLISIYLIIKKLLKKLVRLQPSKSYHIELVASKNLTTGTYPIITLISSREGGLAIAVAFAQL